MDISRLPTIGERKVEPITIAVCIPTGGSVEPETVLDLVTMMVRNTVDFVASDPRIMNLGLAINTQTYIHKSRCELVERALQDGANYLLWIDSDMRFPEDALARLLVHQVDVVGCNYSTRTIPCFPTAILHSGAEGGRRERLLTPKGQEGLVEVDAMGFGLVLTRASVFDKVEFPWFQNLWNPEIEQWDGEDFYFCRAARKAGIRLFCDVGLSDELIHIGKFGYTLEGARAFAVEAQQRGLLSGEGWKAPGSAEDVPTMEDLIPDGAGQLRESEDGDRQLDTPESE